MFIGFKVLLLTFRAYNGMAPAYVCDLVKHYVPGRSGLRSEAQCQLERTVTRLKACGDRSLQYAAFNEWHSLPLNIRSSSLYPYGMWTKVQFIGRDGELSF